jgi:hypothetical protein
MYKIEKKENSNLMQRRGIKTNKNWEKNYHQDKKMDKTPVAIIPE